MRYITLLVLASLIAFLIWLATSDIAESASAQGEIIPAGYVQSVQHYEGGIIEKILVREGEVVERGQSLLQLDAKPVRAEINRLRARGIATPARSQAARDRQRERARLRHRRRRW